jgi:hypothetical protein
MLSVYNAGATKPIARIIDLDTFETQKPGQLRMRRQNRLVMQK